MNLELTDEQTEALIRVLSQITQNDRYPLSPRIVVLKEILRQIRPEPEREPPPPPQRHYEPPSKGTLPAVRMKPYRGLPMTLGNAAAAGNLEQATTW